MLSTRELRSFESEVSKSCEDGVEEEKEEPD